MNGFREKCKKNLRFWAKWPNLGQIWVNFGQKGPFLNFPKKCENVIFFRLQRLGLVQKISKFWWTDWEKNAKNLHFWSFWAKKANFWQFLAKMAKMVKMIKKALGTFFLTFWSLPNCKVSEKNNEGILRKRVTDKRTDKRTDRQTDRRGLNSRCLRILQRTNYLTI